MGGQFGSYQACSSCGSIRVLRLTTPSESKYGEFNLEWVTVKCVGCDRQRVRYQRREGKARV